MTGRQRVIERLYDAAGDWVAASELARSAGVSEAGLGAIVRELIDAGQAIERDSRGRLRLKRPAGIDAHLIERDLNTVRVGRHAICFTEVDSTNDTAAAAMAQPDSDGLVVLADAQRAGRGRHGRTWQSRPGANLLLSVLLCDRAGAIPAEWLTVAAGVAVAEAVESEGVVPEVKWPNDVLVDGAKLAGVLVERRHGPAGGAVVLGVGVNINDHPPDGQIDQPATDLRQCLGRSAERIDLARSLLRRLDVWVARAGQPDRAEALNEAYQQRCGMIGRRVGIGCGGQIIRGRALAVDPLGSLVVLDDAGARHVLKANAATVLHDGPVRETRSWRE